MGEEWLMSEKIIIENRTNLPIEGVLFMVARVISMGRISNYETQYCYHTSFADGIGISTFKNKRSDRFVVFKEIT